MKPSLKRVYSPQQLARRVASLGRAISRDYEGRTVDVVIMLENAFVFAADLLRSISGRVVCHFVRTEIRDMQFGGHDRREIYFSRPPRSGGPRRSGGGRGDAIRPDAGFSAEAAAGKPAALAAAGGACSTSRPSGA